MFDVILLFLLLTLNIFTLFSNVFVANFEQVNVTWDKHLDWSPVLVTFQSLLFQIHLRVILRIIKMFENIYL